MAKIYLSSTYDDLKQHRDHTYRALRRMGHDVIGMENYVATARRPLDKCLDDVAGCDLYIGIIAWRYGYVPEDGNPEAKSITELEFRRASEESGIEELLFLHDEKTPWPPVYIDTGEAADRVRALRDELTRDYVVSFFSSPEQLAGLVTAAVSQWERSHGGDEQATFRGDRANSGSIFEDPDGSRRRFGSQDTKHNDTCWVGRYGRKTSSAFLEVPLRLPGVTLDRVHVKEATLAIHDVLIEGDEITRWLGPLMVLCFDYGELDAGDVEGVLDRGRTIRTFEIIELDQPIDITTFVQELFRSREERLRLAFAFPGRANDMDDPGIIRFEPMNARVNLTYSERDRPR